MQSWEAVDAETVLPSKRQRHDSPDASPPRRQRQNQEDSPQRGKGDSGEVLEHHSQPHTSMPAEGKKKNKVMSDGTVAGESQLRCLAKRHRVEQSFSSFR